MPARILEYGGHFLRHVWRVRQTSALLSLYLHPRQNRWWAFCPPQLCSATTIEWDSSFKGWELLDADLWLAGSLRSVPPGLADQPTAVEPLLPPHQGLHFVLDLGRQLTCLSAYVRCREGVRLAPVSRLVDDPLDPALGYLSDRLVFRTRIAT